MDSPRPPKLLAVTPYKVIREMVRQRNTAAQPIGPLGRYQLARTLPDRVLAAVPPSLRAASGCRGRPWL